MLTFDIKKLLTEPSGLIRSTSSLSLPYQLLSFRSKKLSGGVFWLLAPAVDLFDATSSSLYFGLYLLMWFMLRHDMKTGFTSI